MSKLSDYVFSGVAGGAIGGAFGFIEAYGGFVDVITTDNAALGATAVAVGGASLLIANCATNAADNIKVKSYFGAGFLSAVLAFNALADNNEVDKDIPRTDINTITGEWSKNSESKVPNKLARYSEEENTIYIKHQKPRLLSHHAQREYRLAA